MNSNTFNYLWEQGIVKAAKDVTDEIPIDDMEKYDVKLDVSDKMRKNIHNKYEECRLRVRKYFFNTGCNDENKMDCHKICACITEALLNIRPVSFNMDSHNIPKSIVYSNYAIAFLAPIYIMFLFSLSDYEKNGNKKGYEKLKKQSTFFFPDTNLGHDPYIQGRIKTLALNDICGINFDVLTYADMLFWIEKYNKDLINAIL